MILSNGSSFMFYANFDRAEKQTFDLSNTFPSKEHIKKLRTAVSFDLNISITKIEQSEVHRV